jgi:nicotinate phosphoribosyltransferase
MDPKDNDLADGFLFTDQYELTMAQLYFRAGIHETPAQFDHFFRSYPDYGSHKAGYCINAGLEWLVRWMGATRIRAGEIERLRSLRTRTGEPLFAADFLEWLGENGHFQRLSLEAIPEGRVVHPTVPITVVRGPLAMAQLLESALLNQLNYQTLVATKAARIRYAGRGQPLVDFGMRRAQGRGANAAARAALIGGADFTSNTGISIALGYPPQGTHAHSMVQAFMALGAGELEAFERFADVYPDDCILLVDTIDTLSSGVPNAIRVFERLRRGGHEPVGIRLDSGDLAYLAVRAARMLDDAGFTECRIVLSNQLDERVIQQIIDQIQSEAQREAIDPDRIIGRLSYGVGTHLVTSSGDPALDGVYKLVGIRKNGEWKSAIKLSETPEKTHNPGAKAVWRLYDRRGMATADLVSVSDEDIRNDDPLVLRHPVAASIHRRVPWESLSGAEPLLVPVLDEGRLVRDLPDIEAIRRRRDEDLSRLDEGVKRIINPHVYHVSLSERLWRLKQGLVDAARSFPEEAKDD